MSEAVFRRFEDVFHRFESPLRAAIEFRYGSSGVDCLQIESRSWERAWKQWGVDQFVAVEKPFAWLLSAAEFEYRSERRRGHHRHEHAPPAHSSVGPPDPSAGVGYNPLAQAVRRERDDAVGRVVNEMPELALITRLRYDDRLEWAEVAYVVRNDDTKGEAVRVQYARLLCELARRLTRLGVSAGSSDPLPFVGPESSAAGSNGSLSAFDGGVGS